MNPSTQTVVEFTVWHLAESTAFALLALAIVSAFRLQRSSSRFLIYQLALLKFLLPIGALAATYLQPGVVNTEAFTELATFTVSISSDFLASTSSNASIWISGGIWLAGFLLLSSTRLVGFRRSRLLGTKIQTTATATSKRVNTALRSLNPSEAARLSIFEDDRISSIGLVGFFRPRIIINAAFLETLSDSELLAALRHELAHAQRRDNLWRLSHEFVASLFWFHPLVWILRGKLRAESELACDEFALSQGEEPQSYARCLLKAASTNGHYTNLWVTSFSATPLKNRIRKIITFENKKESKMKLLLTHLALLCALSLIALSSSNLYAEPEDNPAETVYALSDVDKKPSAAVMAAPIYPASMHESKTAGSTVVSFVLDSTGKVQQAQATKSTHREFEEPAINAVLASTWNPAEKDGKPVSCHVRIPIHFQP